MPLPLPKLRAVRPRRHIEPSEPGLREPPARTYAFDPNAARQAWRQVARTRGAHALRLDGHEPGRRLVPLAFGLVAAVAAILWWTTDEDPAPAPAVAALELPGPEPRSVAPAREDGLAPPPAPLVRPAVPVGGSSFREPQAEIEPAPPPPRISRVSPPGTPEHHAHALKKLPHSAQDRAPLGGIGPEGLHVDRITMGTRYRRGTCTGPVGKFSYRNEKVVHLCFRVVHPRREQQVIVNWERDGQVVRRTFVKIGESHGYRTRAGMSLRRRTPGNWKARVMSTDGIELASHAFQIL